MTLTQPNCWANLNKQIYPILEPNLEIPNFGYLTSFSKKDITQAKKLKI